MNFNSCVGNTGKGQGRSGGQWYEWYWGNGLQLLYWWPTESGMIYGVEVNRVRLVAEIVGALPDTPNAPDNGNLSFGVEFIDASERIMYQWGDTSGSGSRSSNVHLPLSPPLGAWSLRAHMGLYEGFVNSRVITLWVNLICIAMLMLLLGIYFYHESTRDLREAEQRVNFVNHVPHQLKTPLTNIRMYAELLDEQLDAELEQESHRLGIILSESQRLSRLIANVLTFSRKQKSMLALRPQPISVDDLIHHILEPFETSFRQKSITVTLELNTPDPIRIDPDWAEQIIGNLLSNVEKYARQEDTVLIRSRID